MTKRCTLWAALGETAVFLLAVWFEPTYIVRGTLRNEAFYDGKPTSWWRRELNQWRIDGVVTADLDTFVDTPKPPWKEPLSSRDSNWCERLQKFWRKTPEPDGNWRPPSVGPAPAGKNGHLYAATSQELAQPANAEPGVHDQRDGIWSASNS